MSKTNDKKMYEKVKELKGCVDIWINYVDSVGNQCAYTDSIAEDILKIARQLKKIYEDQ